MSPRLFGSDCSPKDLNSGPALMPSPTPRVTRPWLRWSRVTTCRATLQGLRLASGVTKVPILIRAVRIATAASAIQGSSMGNVPSGLAT